MKNPAPRVTLEQWRMLQAVVDHGGFAHAAEALHKSQSSVSYGVNKLQDQLGVRALEIHGRKAQLTEAGRLLLRRSRNLLEEAVALERIADSLRQGTEAEIALAVEIIFPRRLVLEGLARFSREYPDTRVELLESVLSGTVEALQTGVADLAVTSNVPAGFLGDPLFQVDFECVAHPDHPLHGLGRKLSLQDLAAHRQVVIRDSGSARRIDAGWLGAEQRWTVSHVTTSIAAVADGMGFAWLPKERIREEAVEGRLAALPLEAGATRSAQLYLAFADPDRAGPATRRLAEVLRACAGCPRD